MYIPLTAYHSLYATSISFCDVHKNTLTLHTLAEGSYRWLKLSWVPLLQLPSMAAVLSPLVSGHRLLWVCQWSCRLLPIGNSFWFCEQSSSTVGLMKSHLTNCSENVEIVSPWKIYKAVFTMACSHLLSVCSINRWHMYMYITGNMLLLWVGRLCRYVADTLI